MKRYTLALASIFLVPAAFGQTSTAALTALTALTLDQAIATALQNHRSMQVSQAALDMAQAQYRQAVAAFGLRVGLEGGFQRADEDRTFTFNGTVMTPVISTPVPGLTIPAQPLPINMDVKMFDRDVTKAGVNASYPLYTGGKEAAVTALARKNMEIAKQDQRRTELDVVRDVSRYYHAAQYARQMEALTGDAAERFQVLEDLTERLFQSASLKVKRTDYLRTRTMTAMTRTLMLESRYAAALTREALANAMGLPLNATLTLAAQTDVPVLNAALDTLLAQASQFNPDRQKLELAVQAADLQIEDASSGLKPVVGLEANAYQVWNAYQGGLFNDANRTGWTIGIGVKWDLFDSGMTRAGIDAARAGKMKLEAQRVLLDAGQALQIKDDFMRIERSRAQWQESTKAKAFAEESRTLHEKAYQSELVETKDVIEAQMIESFAGAALYRAGFELRSAIADLDYRVGSSLKGGAKP